MRRYRVALVDFGVKTNIERCLTERGCLVRVFPMTVIAGGDAAVGARWLHAQQWSR